MSGRGRLATGVRADGGRSYATAERGGEVLSRVSRTAWVYELVTKAVRWEILRASA